MALIIKDRVKEVTTTTGTGAVSLGGASATFDAFQSVMSNGDTTFYAIVHTSSGTDEWEVGLGTWNTGNTLTRTTVYAGSNGASAVNFSSGNKDIFMTYPASKAAVAGEDVTFADITATDITSTGTVTLSADPSSALQAATKQYVDTIAAAGIHYHAPVRVEHPSNLNATYNNGSSGVGATLTNAGTNAALVLDNVSMVLNDRVLVANQTDQTQNGVYTVTTVGDASTAWVLTRSTDTDSYAPSDGDSLGEGDAFFIKEGDTNAGHLDVMTTSGTITFGTTNIVFSEVAETSIYSAGTGLTLTGTTFSTNQDISTSASPTFNNITVTGTVDGRDVATDGSKLDGIEAGATADQTASEIKTAYESNSNTNAFTDAEQTKLSGIETGATGDQTASEILTAIKTVDGSASGLDADLLDGQQGSYYLNTSTSFSGDVSGTYNNIVVANDSHTHDGRYYTETEADTRFLRGNTSDTMSGNLTVDNGTSSSIIVQSDDGGTSGIYLRGVSQGTGFVEVGQSSTYGGGMYYNGDGSPAFASGETADTIGFYRLSNGTRTEVFYYPHNSNTVTFNGSIAVGGTVDGRDVASDGTKLDGIASGATNTSAPNNATITLSAGTNLSGGGNFTTDQSANETITFNVSSTPSFTSATFGSGVTLAESTDRADLLQITSTTSGWGGLQVRNSSNEGRWSFMTDGSAAGIYDDENNHWHIYMTENAGPQFRYAGVTKMTIGSTYTEMAQHLDMNNYDIYGADQIFHHGDTDTYMQFHGDNLWRVVCAGSEQIEVGSGYVLMNDNKTFRMGTGSDFRMYFNGTDMVFRNYAHTGGDFFFQGEGSDGINRNAIKCDFSGTNAYVELYNNSTVVLSTNGGVSISSDLNLNNNDLTNVTLLNGGTPWHSGNDGSGSGLDADTVDGIQASSFLRSDAADTASGAITLSADTTDVLNFSANSTNDNRGISFNGRTAISADYNDGWLRINNAIEFTSGVYIPSGMWISGTLDVSSTIRHQGDNDTSISFGTNTITLATGGHSEITVNSTGVRLGDTGNGYFQPVSGNYGSVQIDGGAHSGWEGYSIGGRAVFMHDNSARMGLYDDTNNHWGFFYDFGGAAYLTHSGSTKLSTSSTGVVVTGNLAVSGTVDGRDVASDGSKLDGIESGATADQTASEILTAIKTVDGSGSGLDADLWDGNQFGSYINQPLTSGSNPTFQSLYLANSLIHLGDTDTYITFGTDMMFFTCGNTDRIVANSNGVSVTGALTATGNITAYYSDERLKTKTGDLDGALEKIKQLNGFYYVENDLAKELGFDNDEQQVALSAQEVQAVMPEAVSLAPFDFAKDDETGENLPNASKSGENYLTVDYARLVPLLIEAIKEQQTQIDDLQAKLGM